MTKHLKIAAALTLLLAPVSAWAQSINDDVRCLLLASTFSRATKQAQAQAAAQAAIGYYVGRIDGRVPPAMLKTALSTQAKELTKANAPSLMNACINRMVAASRAIEALSPQGTPAPTRPPAGR